MKQLLRLKGLHGLLGLLIIAALLYLLNIRFLLAPLLVASFVISLPFPRLVRSILSRIVVSLLLVYSVLQLALVVQFLVLPESDFRTLALLALLIAVAIILLARKIYIPPREKTIWIDRKDIIALCVAAIFVVPFGWYCFGPSGLLHITTMAGIQVPDATNHFISLSDMSKVQHLSHQLGYYPKGFDMSSALIQNSFGLNQTVLPWATNAYLFMFQYVAWNGILAYFLGYFAYLLLEKFDGREQAPPSGFLLVLSIGIPLTILYLLPFIFEGFLNFSYVCATIAGSYIYLAAIGETNSQPLRRWYILGYLLMIFGVSFSWPLLTPPLLLTPLLYFWPQRFRFTDVKLSLINRRNLPVIIGFAMQLIPLYMDFRYSTPGSNSVNTPGALSVFHWGILAASLASVSYLLLSKAVSDEYKRLVKSIFLPFVALVGGLVLFQCFTVGQPIYYAIKSTYILEVLFLVLGAAWLVHLFSQSKLSQLENLVIVAVLPFLAYVTLTGISGNNPLDDMRKLLRDHSHFGKPAFLDADSAAITNLGKSGKILDFNVTVLHYESAEQKLYANMQPAYWANATHYSDDPANGTCSIGSMYGEAMYQAFSPAQQADLTKTVGACIQLAEHNHEAYYIVSDATSAQYIRNIFGDYPTIIH